MARRPLARACLVLLVGAAGCVRICEGAASAGEPVADAPSCIDAKTRRQQSAKPTPAPTRLLPVALRVTTQGDFTPEERTVFMRALRAVLGIWVVNCLPCNFDVLSVVRVDEQAWGRADLVNPTIHQMSALSQFAKTPAQELLLQRRMGFAPTAVAGDELYVALPTGTMSSLPICHEESVSAPEVLRVKQSLGCGPSGPNPNEVFLILALRPDGRTTCGSSTNDIACEADNELLEFNTRDYTFCLSEAGDSCIGKGPRRVSLLHVLLHEAGHWLGLGHIEMRNAIMASTFDFSRCLSDADAQALLDSLTAQSRLKAARASFRLQASVP